MNRVQKTRFTRSFFPDASIAASVSAFIAQWIRLSRNTKRGRKQGPLR
jgi:hypothetical protein